MWCVFWYVFVVEVGEFFDQMDVIENNRVIFIGSNISVFGCNWLVGGVGCVWIICWVLIFVEYFVSFGVSYGKFFKRKQLIIGVGY